MLCLKPAPGWVKSLVLMLLAHACLLRLNISGVKTTH